MRGGEVDHMITIRETEMMKMLPSMDGLDKALRWMANTMTTSSPWGERGEWQGRNREPPRATAGREWRTCCPWTDPRWGCSRWSSREGGTITLLRRQQQYRRQWSQNSAGEDTHPPFRRPTDEERIDGTPFQPGERRDPPPPSAWRQTRRNNR